MEATEWYPQRKCTADPLCPEFVDLDLFESDQVQEAWAIEGNVGPEVMCWRDGRFVAWWPKLTMERAAVKLHILASEAKTVRER